MTLPERLELPEEVVAIAERLEEAGFETWCVGGALRDRLLGHPADDVDLATAAPPDTVQRLFPRTVAVGLKYGTVGVVDRRRQLHEVTTFRRDVTTDGRHAVVAYGVSLEEDLARRDFTMNALAYHPLRHTWRDPFGGSADLAAGVIRAVGDPAMRFAEDFLRILRALRFAARFDFRIEDRTWEAAQTAAAGLRGLSAERVRDEWMRGLETARSVARLVGLWRDVGAAAVWLPELKAEYPFAAEPPMPRDPVVLTAGLCDTPDEVLRRLRGSGDQIGRAVALARGPLRPAGPSDADARRWLAAVGDAAGDLLLLARYLEGTAPAWAGAVEGVRARGEATCRKQLAVTGDDLVAAGVPPGPTLGRLLDRLLDEVLADPSHNRRDTLLELVRQWR